MGRMKTKIAYPILEGEIASRGIKKKDIAEALHVVPRTLSRKLSGEVEFTLSEVIYIHSLMPELSIERIFGYEEVQTLQP